MSTNSVRTALRSMSPMRIALRAGCLVAVLVSATGCASALTAAGRNVRLMTSDPPPTCTEVGTVSGRTAFDLDGAKNKMRNEAAEQSANYVRFEAVEGQYHTTGTAYRCPALENRTPLSSPAERRLGAARAVEP